MVTPRSGSTQGAMESAALRNSQSAARPGGHRRMSCSSDDPKVRIQGLSYWYGTVGDDLVRAGVLPDERLKQGRQVLFAHRVSGAPGVSPVEAPGETLVIIGAVHAYPQSNLLQVIETVGFLRFGLGFGQRRQKHARQHGDDRDDDQQFNKGETSRSWRLQVRFHTGGHNLVQRCWQAWCMNSMGFGEQLSPAGVWLTRPPSKRMTALLRHEIAHLRRHDLAWKYGWRWWTL